MSYDIQAVLRALVDADSLDPFQPQLATELLCADARFEGSRRG